MKFLCAGLIAIFWYLISDGLGTALLVQWLSPLQMNVISTDLYLNILQIYKIYVVVTTIAATVVVYKIFKKDRKD